MLQAMAEENREIGQHDIKIMTSTIEQVKNFLDGELARFETWKQARSSKFTTTLFENGGNFGRAKKEGVGQKTILKFLNGGKKDGTWKQSEIQFALELLGDKDVDRDAVEMFDNHYQAKEFRCAVRNSVSKGKQKEVSGC